MSDSPTLENELYLDIWGTINKEEYDSLSMYDIETVLNRVTAQSQEQRRPNDAKP